MGIHGYQGIRASGNGHGPCSCHCHGMDIEHGPWAWPCEDKINQLPLALEITAGGASNN